MLVATELLAIAPVVGAAIIGGAASLIGGFFGNKARKSAAKQDREWQERMSNTAYQRSMDDMRKAGLNPMLAYSQGGAATGKGAMAGVENIGAGIDKAVQTGLGAKRLQQDIEVLKASKLKIDAEAQRSQTGAAVDRATVLRLHQDTLTSAANQAQTETNNQLLKLSIPGAANQAAIESGTMGMFYKHLKNLGLSPGAFAAGLGGGLLSRGSRQNAIREIGRQKSKTTRSRSKSKINHSPKMTPARMY